MFVSSWAEDIYYLSMLSKTAVVYKGRLLAEYFAINLQSQKESFFSFQFFVKPCVITLFSEKHMPTIASVIMYY